MNYVVRKKNRIIINAVSYTHLDVYKRQGYMICSSANGRGHLYIAPMDETKNFCDFDFDNIKELNGSTGSYFDEDGTIKQKDKGGIEGDCMFKYKDHYYFTGSDLYGWRGSRVYVFESKDILGDYKLKPDYIDTSKSSSNLPYIMPGAKYSYCLLYTSRCV